MDGLFSANDENLRINRFSLENQETWRKLAEMDIATKNIPISHTDIRPKKLETEKVNMNMGISNGSKLWIPDDEKYWKMEKIIPTQEDDRRKDRGW